MDEITKQIEEMAEKMEKSSADPKESLFDVIESLGPDGLKEKMATLSDDEKVVLKAALEEMTLEKGRGPDKAPRKTRGESRMADRQSKLSQNRVAVASEAKKIQSEKEQNQRAGASAHQSQTAKLLSTKRAEARMNKSEEDMNKAVSFDTEAQSAKTIQGKLTDTIIQEEIASDDADEKLVKPEANAHPHQGTPTDGWSGQVIKALEENLDQVVAKAMEMCKDDKMIAKKLKEKGMDGAKVQGALDKYKAGKEVQKSESEDLEKGRGPDKQQRKPRNSGEAGKFTHDSLDAVSTAAMGSNMPEEKRKQVLADLDEKRKKLPPKMEKSESETTELQKSCSWEGPERLLKANTLGRNHNFNVEHFITETLKLEPEIQELQKSEGEDDLNDIIEKGGDCTWEDLDQERRNSEATITGTLVKSFDDVKDLAKSLGISEEEAEDILNE